MRRRGFTSLLGAGVLLPLNAAVAPADSPVATLFTADLQLGGEWGGSAPRDAALVIESMRAACLAGVPLVSDRQPEKLRVDDGSGSNPSVWLHTDFPTTAWIRVIVGTRDWCNLAYQFGHELGHVLCNSWQSDAAPLNPCQWVEEALVEAFSQRGLGQLADAWMQTPPFPNDAAYANSIRSYAGAIRTEHQEAARDQGMAAGFAAWFKAHKSFLDQNGGLDAAIAAVPTMLGLLESDTAAIADLGALNRWPERSGVPLPRYLDLWQKSCTELKAPGRLPERIRQLVAAA